jgi:Flp pilus assembly pilin Flp
MPTGGAEPSLMRRYFEDNTLVKLSKFANALWHGEEGASTAEYGILIVIAAGIAIFVLSNLNSTLTSLFGKFAAKANQVN